MPSEEIEIVVVGGGLAGLVAGVRAAELGAGTTVLEAGTGRYPSNSRYTGGVFHLAFRDVTSPPDELARALRAASEGFSDDDLLRALADDAGTCIEWLADHGAVFDRGGEAEWMSRMLVPFSLQVPGFSEHWPDKGAERLLGRLAERLTATGGQLLLGTRARSLVTESRRVTGVVVTGEDGAQRTLRADAVVIADGGFQGNADLVRRYISPDPSRLCQRGAGTGRGDGLAMAQAVGARLVHMDRFYGHVQASEAVSDDRVWPYPILDLVTSSAVVVDGSGRRFADEGLGGVPMANAIARLEDPLSAFVVMDTAIWEGAGRTFLLPPNPTLAERGVQIHRADTIEALAGLIGVPPEALADTVATYNRARVAGTLGRLDPPRTSAGSTLAATAEPIEQGPFLAIRLAAGITYTMGGIAIDADARVVDEVGDVIPGLFAAGSATGGFEGGPKSVYLGGLTKAAVFGKRAAESVVRAGSARTAIADASA